MGTGVGVVETLCLLCCSSMKKIENIVTRAKVMITFFIHLHFVSMMNVRNVRKLIKKKKNICSTE